MHFPTSGVDAFPLWPFLIALVISFFTSMGGISGAFLLLPYQVTFLGFTSPAVSSTNLVYNIVAIPGGIYRHIREGRMAWPLCLVMIAGLVPGVTAGAYVRIRYLPDPAVFKLFVGCVLLYIGARLVVDIARGWKREAGAPRAGPQDGAGEGRVRTRSIGLRRISYSFKGETYSYSPILIFLFVGIVGVVGGAYGIGGGALVAPVLVSVFHLPVHTIAGAALASTVATSVIGVVVYTWIVPLMTAAGTDAAPDWLLGGLLGLGGMVGIYLGTRVQKHVPARWIKVMLACVLLFVAGKYVLEFIV